MLREEAKILILAVVAVYSRQQYTKVENDTRRSKDSYTSSSGCIIIVDNDTQR